MPQIDRTLQDTTTSLAPGDVLTAATRFFARRNGVYTAFLDMQGENFVSLRGQGGEEIIIAATARNGVTRVTGSTYLFDQQVARFLSTLPAPDRAAAQDLVEELPAAGEGAA